jgi:hypothetical protein
MAPESQAADLVADLRSLSWEQTAPGVRAKLWARGEHPLRADD